MLLDGVTPTWGRSARRPTGKEFEVTRPNNYLAWTIRPDTPAGMSLRLGQRIRNLVTPGRFSRCSGFSPSLWAWC